MAQSKVAPFVAAAAACVLLFAAVAFNDFSKDIDLEAAAHSAGLVQTGKGLSLSAKNGKWDVAASKGDARLADQIAGWTKSKSGEKPKARTEELADMDVKPKPSLKQQMHTAADSLRLSDFLSGVKPETTQQQVERLYAKMDPKDKTGWKERDAAFDPKPTKKAQVKEISHFQNMLQSQLSTTPNLDSPHAQKVRSELKQLLQKRAELKAKIERREARERRAEDDKAADQDDALLKSLARTEDNASTYKKWLQDSSSAPAKAAKRPVGHVVEKPVITAGGQLKWKSSGEGQGVDRAEKLRAAQGRLQKLSESTKQERRGRSSNADLVDEAEAEDDPQDSMESIQQRAAYKVNRWMGGGYVKVYDLGSGR